MTITTDKTYMTWKETHEYLGISRDSLYRVVARGDLPVAYARFFGLRKRRYFLRTAVEELKMKWEVPE